MKARIFNIMQYECHPDTGKVLLTEEKIKDALAHRMITRWAYIKHDKDVYSALDEEQYELRQVEKAKQQKQIEINIELGQWQKEQRTQVLDIRELMGKKNEQKRQKQELQEEQLEECTQEQDIQLQDILQMVKDEQRQVKKGDIKPAHWHIVIESKNNAIEIGVIAKWFGISDNYVNIAKGAGAFLDCVQYLTHESDKQQGLGKRLYEDDEVKANFAFRALLDKRAEQKAKYGYDLDPKDELRRQVFDGELSLREVQKKYPMEYINDRDKLIKLRLDYIQKAPLPKARYNYYICGDGGQGKDTASIFLAHALYPKIENDDDLFFITGAEGATFEGYDGQPVIIWSDCRSGDLFKKLGTRGNIFNVFDTTPHRQSQNIKYGATNLINEVNIVNSVQPFDKFLDNLVGEYTDKDGQKHTAEDNEKAQSYRRFPFIMPLRADDFDILINQAYMDGESRYDTYMRYLCIKGNFGKLIRMMPKGSIEKYNMSTGESRPYTEEELKEIEKATQKAQFIANKMLKPLVDARDEKQRQLNESKVIEGEFEGWGEPQSKGICDVGGEEVPPVYDVDGEEISNEKPPF